MGLLAPSMVASSELGNLMRVRTASTTIFLSLEEQVNQFNCTLKLGESIML